MTFSLALIGAPVQSGASQAGCLMGPDALRTAGLAGALQDLGHTVVDLGNVAPQQVACPGHGNPAIRTLGDTVGWALALEDAACRATQVADIPIFLGGGP